MLCDTFRNRSVEQPGLAFGSITRREALKGLLISTPLLGEQALPSTERESASHSSSNTACTHVTVIDGAVSEDQNVIFSGDRITAVGPSPLTSVAVGARIIDGRGRFLIPGLWDCHAHLSYFKQSALPVLLANGVTSVRDMGGLLDEVYRWKTETNCGIRPGPRIFCAGPILNGKVFNEYQVAVTDAAEARGTVRVLKSVNVDFVKVDAAISRDAYFGVQSECQERGLRYVGHMPRAITPEEASNAGQWTLEHVGAFADRFASQGVADNDMAATLARFRTHEAPAMFAVFARNRTWFTPTLIASKSAIHLGDHQPDPRDKYVSASCKRITEELLKRPSYQSFLAPGSVERQEREFAQLPPLVEQMHSSGVPLLAGTDFAVSVICPGFSLHDELELLVESGLKPVEALQTATSNPATVLGQDDLGAIKAGNLADMVLLDANPLTDIRNTRSIRMVISRGECFDRDGLDQLLANAAMEAART
jgi:imidazolonepropionase-like amidohydrolase